MISTHNNLAFNKAVYKLGKDIDAFLKAIDFKSDDPEFSDKLVCETIFNAIGLKEDDWDLDNFSIKEINISGDWIHEFLGNKISELSELLNNTQENIDELTEMNNLDWELGSTINKVNTTVLNSIKSFCTKNKYIKVDLDDNFIYYNGSQIFIKLDDQVFIFKLKGSLLDDATLYLVMSFNKSKLVNFSSRLNKLLEV